MDAQHTGDDILLVPSLNSLNLSQTSTSSTFRSTFKIIMAQLPKFCRFTFSVLKTVRVLLRRYFVIFPPQDVEGQAVVRMKVVWCPGFDDLKSLYAESTDESCEQAGVGFDVGGRSADEVVFGLVIGRFRSKA